MVAPAVGAFVSFTEVSPPSAHRGYHAWHALDHLPEQYRIGGILRGERWAATPRCRTARLVDTEVLSAAHYFTLYLLADPVHETLEEFLGLGARLRAEGRFFEQRRAVLAGPLRVAELRAAPSALVSAAAVPFRPTTGVYVVVDREERGEKAVPPAHPEPHRCLGPAALEAVLELDGVAGVLELVAAPELPQRRQGQASTESVAVSVVFLDGDVVRTARRIDALIGRGTRRPSVRALQRGPYEALTRFATDVVEELERA